jgi:uncharacterized membrane protein YeaQ/YmgE (transglycosylase-associated protein family)
VSIIAWILLGLVAGVIAKALSRGPEPGGILGTLVVGVVGALVGGVTWNLLTGNDSYGDFDIGGIIIAVVGALIFLAVYKRVVARG